MSNGFDPQAFEQQANAGFDEAQRKLDELAAQAADNERRATALAEDVENITATASSRNGEVAVTARVGGRLTDVRFSERAYDLSPHALGQLVLQTIADAQHAAMAALADRGSELFGADSAIAANLRADADRAYPAGSADGIA